MRIVFVSYTYWPPDFGGELLMSIERLRSLASRGARVTILTAGNAGFPRKQEHGRLQILRSPAVGASRLARVIRRAVFLPWSIGQLLILKYELAHLGSLPGFDAGTSALAGILMCLVIRLRRARSAYVLSLADSETVALALSGPGGALRTAFLRQLNHVVAVSPGIFRPLQIAAPGRAQLLVNAVQDHIFKPITSAARASIRGEAGVKEDEVVFSFVGSVSRRKGFDLLAEAFSALASGNPRWRLWVIGPRTREESQNLDLIETEEVSRPLQEVKSRVTFWGRVDDRRRLAGILGATDVFVFPSRREGFGIAPVEAMAAGVPVIVARIPGITDLANIEGVTGLYIESGSVDELTAAMLRLGRDRKLRVRIGRQAARRARQEFGWEAYIDKWEALYGSCAVADSA